MLDDSAVCRKDMYNGSAIWIPIYPLVYGSEKEMPVRSIPISSRRAVGVVFNPVNPRFAALYAIFSLARAFCDAMDKRHDKMIAARAYVLFFVDPWV